MSTTENRTPERLLIIGSSSFAGIDAVAWSDQIVPNIPDYDVIIVSVPHITEEFLSEVDGQFFKDMRKSLVRFLHSGGKMIVLVSARITVNRPAKYPENISNNDWCPITYETPNEHGKSMVVKNLMYPSYLKKMEVWSFYLKIPNSCLSSELTDFYGATYNTKYNVPFESYLENRYGRILAGQYFVEVTKERKKANEWNSWTEYPEIPDQVTGTTILLPLIDKVSAEEALASILHEEIGYSAKSTEPAWVKDIQMPFVDSILAEIADAETIITHQRNLIEKLDNQISELQSFRRLIFGTGFELEDIVRDSLQRLGAKVTAAKYAQEEYILEIDGVEFLMEVKGVNKSITLTHLRQLNDYLLKYQEDTGKECKGILFGNPWRNIPPHMRGSESTPLFPDNVVKRAEQWGIALISSIAYFNEFSRALEDHSLSQNILSKITTVDGVVDFSQ